MSDFIYDELLRNTRSNEKKEIIIDSIVYAAIFFLVCFIFYWMTEIAHLPLPTKIFS